MYRVSVYCLTCRCICVIFEAAGFPRKCMVPHTYGIVRTWDINSMIDIEDISKLHDLKFSIVSASKVFREIQFFAIVKLWYIFLITKFFFLLLYVILQNFAKKEVYKYTNIFSYINILNIPKLTQLKVCSIIAPKSF